MQKEQEVALDDATPIVPSQQVVEALQVPQQRIIVVPEYPHTTSELRWLIKDFFKNNDLTPVYKPHDNFTVNRGQIFLVYSIDKFQNIVYFSIRYLSKKNGLIHEIWTAKMWCNRCCCGPCFNVHEKVTHAELDQAIAIIDINEEDSSSSMTRA